MSLDIYQIAEAFCSYRFAVTYPYMADEIKWDIVGREELMGDVFQFSDERLVEIRSYVIELK